MTSLEESPEETESADLFLAAGGEVLLFLLLVLEEEMTSADSDFFCDGLRDLDLLLDRCCRLQIKIAFEQGGI